MNKQTCAICGKEKDCWWMLRRVGSSEMKPVCELCEHIRSKPKSFYKKSLQEVDQLDAMDMVSALIELEDEALNDRVLENLGVFQKQKWENRLKRLQKSDARENSHTNDLTPS